MIAECKTICAYNAQMKLPPLENLRVFEAVARLQGFTSAAEHLALSHSAVSRRVSELEARLNVQLLHRTSRRVELTERGKVLFEAAQEALARIEQATVKITRQQSALLVSCERSLAMRWLIPRLSAFQDAHPDLPIYLSSGGGPLDLERENIDVAIRRADFPLDPRLTRVHLFPEYVGPVLSARASPARFETLAHLHTTGRPDAWSAWARRARPVEHAALQPSRGRPDQYFDHFFLSLQAAEAGLGVAIAPFFMVLDNLAAGTLVAPAGFIPDGTEYVALLCEPPAESGPVAQFVSWLHGAATDTLAQLPC